MSSSQSTQCLSGCTHSTVYTSSPYKPRRMWTEWRGPKKAINGDQRAREPALWGKTEGVGLFSLEKRRLSWELITEFQYLKDSHKEDGGSFSMRIHMEKTRCEQCGRRFILTWEKITVRWEFTAATSPGTWGNPHRWKISRCEQDAR